MSESQTEPQEIQEPAREQLLGFGDIGVAECLQEVNTDAICLDPVLDTPVFPPPFRNTRTKSFSKEI